TPWPPCRSFILPPPPSTPSPFPYTTLFRSRPRRHARPPLRPGELRALASPSDRHRRLRSVLGGAADRGRAPPDPHGARGGRIERSEEHTSELQSRGHLVCRLLLEKKDITVL